LGDTFVNRFQSIGTLLSAITTLLAVLLVSTFTISALGAYQREELARTVLSVVTGARNIMSAMIAVRGEVAVANLALEAPQAAAPAAVAELGRLHARSESALNFALREIARRPFSDARSRLTVLLPADHEYRAMLPSVVAAIRQPRTRRNGALLADWKRVTTLLSRQLAVQSAILGEHMPGADPSIDHMMKVNNNAWSMRLDAGRDRGFMQTAVIDNKVPAPALQQSLAETKGKIDARWADIETEAQHSSIPPVLKQVIAETRKVYFTDYRDLRDDVLRRLVGGEKLYMSGAGWIEASNPGLSSILAVSTTALDLTEAYAREQAIAARRSFFVHIALMLLSLGLACFTACYVLWRVIRPLRVITGTMTTIAGGALAAPDSL
jgi:hypothetical protein